MLIDRLPPESATNTAIRDSATPAERARIADQVPRRGHGPWAVSDYHRAAIIDELRALRQAVIASGGGSPSRPEPYPRPGVDAPDERGVSDEARDFMQRRRAQINAQIEAARAADPAHSTDTEGG